MRIIERPVRKGERGRAAHLHLLAGCAAVALLAAQVPAFAADDGVIFNGASTDGATAPGTFAFGISPSGGGTQAAAQGFGSVAEGLASSGNTSFSLAVGAGASAGAGDAPSLIAVPIGTTTTGGAATAIGSNAVANGLGATAVGGKIATVSTDFGARAIAAGASAFGSGASARGVSSVSIGQDSQASAAGAIAIGGGTSILRSANAASTGAVAIGTGAFVFGTNSVALGANSEDAGQNNVVSVGNFATQRRIINVANGTVAADSTDAVNGGQLFAMENGQSGAFQANNTSGRPAPQATGADSVAGGFGAVASGPGATAVGTGAVASGDPTSAFGFQAAATGANATALGANAVATGANSVALGQGSIATAPNTVSVGAPGATRRITNVAAGTDPTDAVNVGQLNGMSRQMRRNQDRAYGGIAAALASAALRFDDRPGKFSLAAGAGGWNGQAGVAGGVGYTTEDSRMRMNVGFAISPSSGRRTDVGGMGGLTWTLN